MHAQYQRATSVEPSLTLAWEQLQAQYAAHHKTAPFWSAYQAIQEELLRFHPQHQVDVCNHLAGFAERLGAVDAAQLLEPAHRSTAHTGSTSS